MRSAVTKITNHVSLALARMLYQYRILPATYALELPITGGTVNTSRLGAIIAALVDQLQHIENEMFAIDNGRMYFDGTTFPAEGEQLDGIGDILGISRNGLTDKVYRLFLAAKIAQDNSSGTIEDVLYLVRLLFQAPLIQMFEAFPGEINFHLTSAALDSSLYQVAEEMVRRSLPAGVLLGGISVTSAAEVFTFCSVATPSSVGGFSNTGNAAPLYNETGGVFAALI